MTQDSLCRRVLGELTLPDLGSRNFVGVHLQGSVRAIHTQYYSSIHVLYFTIKKIISVGVFTT